MNNKVSVIIPIYNSENFLVQCIESVTNQTHKNLEIILINDGSPDNSISICEKYSKIDDRILVINQKNAGQASAWETATYLSKGDYLVYVDADDWINEKIIEKALIVAIEKGSEIVFWPFIKEFHSYSKPENPIFKNDQTFFGSDLIWLRRRVLGLLNEETENPLRTDAINSVWGKLIKRNLVIDSNLHFESTRYIGSTDVLFINELMRKASIVSFLNFFGTHYRQYNPSSLTKNYQLTLYAKFKNLFFELEKRIMNENCTNEERIAFENRIAFSLINICLSLNSDQLTISLKGRVAHLKMILNDAQYGHAIQQLSINYLPVHWKLFFLLAKWKLANSLFLVSVVMKRLR
jgi:glycosyltransferase involved in cell wall biosynthesis